jgi:hypothetical protein
MKETNRFLMLIIIIFSIVAFAPTPFDHMTSNVEMSTIYQNCDIKLTVDNEFLAIVSSASYDSENKYLNLSTVSTIRAIETWTDSEALIDYSLEDCATISLDISSYSKGTYLLGISTKESSDPIKFRLIKS